MDISQFYETTVIDSQHGFCLHFISIPRRSIDARYRTVTDAIEALKALDIKPHCRITSARAGHALLALLEIEGSLDKRIDNLNNLAESEPEAFEFARFVATNSEIPIEQSPLSGETLANLIEGSPAGIGAALGFMVAAGSSPILIVYVATGILIISVAAGVAEGLRERIKKAIIGGDAIDQKKKKKKRDR